MSETRKIVASPEAAGRRLDFLMQEMNREVNTLKNTLEQKVEERTRQLAESNQQLLDAQKELAKAERLAGLGMLAAGVAHEIPWR